MATEKWWNSAAVTERAKIALLEAAEDEMTVVGNAAQALAPRRTGRMRNTARLESFGGDHVSIKYGGGSAPYAPIQERPWQFGRIFRHYTTPGTGPRYLETPFLNRIGDWATGQVNKTTFKRMEAYVRARLKSSL